MRFLPQAYTEFKPPATYRLWRRAGLADHLPFWGAVMAPPVVFAASDHHYQKVLELLLVAAAVLIAMAFVPAGRLGKPAVEIVDDVLTIRMRLYLPARTATLALAELRQVMVRGPEGNRDWRFVSKADVTRQFRPNLGEAMDDALTTLLRSAARGRFQVIDEAPYDPVP